MSTWTNYGYDAAGRATDLWTDDINGNETTQTQVFDGDGTRTKLRTQRTIYNADNSITNEDETQYFVTSSVLGGVVTELDEAGQKERTFVYEGGRVLAWQQKDGTTESVAWEYRDPSGASVRVPGLQPFGSGSAELEPLGSNAGLAKLITPRPPESLKTRTYPGFGDAYGQQCMMDGVDMPCDTVSRAFSSGALTFQSWTTVRVTHTDGRRQTFQGWTTLAPGLDLRFTGPNAQNAAHGFNIYGDVLGGDFNDAVQGAVLGGSAPTNNRDGLGSVLGGFAFSFLPQNGVAVNVPVTNLKKLIQDRLNYGDCADYVAKLIAKAAELHTKFKNDPISTDIMTLYKMINQQARGGFRLNAVARELPERLRSVSSGSGVADGNLLQGTGIAVIFMKGGFTDNPKSISRLPYDYGISGIHELIHLAGQKALYDETLLGQAAAALEPKYIKTSWDSALKDHCLPPEWR